ncbi:hypothetical protein QZH41_011664 [Actinostola sp. cb2023]|nr:hypothetical protein QZH41_011664 [Actinostola sp. cb2023]
MLMTPKVPGIVPRCPSPRQIMEPTHVTSKVPGITARCASPKAFVNPGMTPKIPGIVPRCPSPRQIMEPTHVTSKVPGITARCVNPKAFVNPGMTLNVPGIVPRCSSPRQIMEPTHVTSKVPGITARCGASPKAFVNPVPGITARCGASPKAFVNPGMTLNVPGIVRRCPSPRQIMEPTHVTSKVPGITARCANILKLLLTQLRLPEYFSPWEKVCDDIPQMLKDGTTRCIIEKLPLLEFSLLSSKEEWYRAFLLLTDMTQSYVWCQGEEGVAKVLPKCVAIPLIGVSQYLDMPPLVTHFSQALCNWRRVGLNESDICLINTFTGTECEEGFFITALAVELEFGKGGANAVLDDDTNQLLSSLTSLQQIINNMISAFLKVHDVCDPQDFYCLLRPFLTGWGEGSALTNGLIYEGVSTEPMKYAGGSAAQSTVFQVIDAFLGITHATENGEEHFLDKMRLHMPPKHRAFISAIENGPSVKCFVLQKNSNLLTEKYNGCLDALHEFRSVHIRVVAK